VGVIAGIKRYRWPSRGDERLVRRVSFEKKNPTRLNLMERVLSAPLFAIFWVVGSLLLARRSHY
jgi:hypothetical protein